MHNIIKEYLKDVDWHYTQGDDKNAFFFGMAGKNGNFQCVADFIEEKNFILFFSIYGVNVPFDKRHQILELINQINYRNFFGNFEMDSEGEIRYKTSSSLKYMRQSKEMLDEIIMTNIITMDDYISAFTGVMFGGLTPLKAIEQIDASAAKSQ